MRFGFAIVALAATSASSAFVAPTRKKHTTFISVKPYGPPAVVSHVALEKLSRRVSIVGENSKTSIEPEKAKQSKRMTALKTLGKVAGAVGTIALATGGAPEIALATRRGVRTTKTVVQVVETVDKTNRLVATAVVGATLACVIGKRLVDTFMRGVDTKATEDKIAEAFPGSLKNKDLVVRVKQALRKYDYGSDSLLVTSLDPDEINRVLEKDFGYAFKENYNMGGLAGFPFGGTTAFATMAGHIPRGGNCLIVFGPHVGVDSKGNVGTVERRGRAIGGPCCASSIAASAAVTAVVVAGGERARPRLPVATTTVPMVDEQQNLVIDMLLPYADRLEKIDDKMVELPYCMYDAQKKMMTDIVHASYGAMVGFGRIAVLGGIQINTPPDQSDYYLPLSLEVYNNKGRKVDDLTL